MCRLRPQTYLYLPIIVFILYMAASPAMAYPVPVTVTVKVLNYDGSPAADIRVVLQNGNYAYLNNGMTNDSGVCIFTVDPGSGAVRALVTSQEYNITSVWYEASDMTIEVKLPKMGGLSGTVKLGGMSSGNPLVVLDDSEIFDSTPYDVSRQNGSSIQTFTVNRFSFTTTAGSHVLYAAGYSDGKVYLSDRLAINISENQAPVVLELKQAGNNASILPPDVYQQIFHTSNTHGGLISIAGTLIGADDRPLANATLTAQDYYMNEPGTTITGANGSFSFVPLNLSTEVMRFKAVIPGNGIAYTSYSTFYPAQNNSSLEVKLTDYPKSTVGYIYGIIALTGNRSNPVPISGTVYLSNGLTQVVSGDKNSSQFFFTVPPGSYDIYAEHIEGSERMVSEKVRVNVEPVWSPLAVNPTVLVVKPEDVQYMQLAFALVIGLLCVAGVYSTMRKWL